VAQLRVAVAARVRWQPQVAGDLGGLDLEALDLDRFVVLVDLDLALPGHHDRFVWRTDVLVGGRLHVDDPQVGPARRGPNAQNPGLDLDRVSHVDRRAEAHVDVLEVRASVLRDVLDRLREGDQHRQRGRAHQPLVAVGARVVRVLGQRVRAHREIAEDRQQAIGDGLAAVVPEHLPGAEVLEEVAGLLADDERAVRHGRGVYPRPDQRRQSLSDQS
jgi:hypothetical protein